MKDEARGLAELAPRVVGLAVWAMVSAPTIAHGFAGVRSVPIWIILDLAFAIGFWIATDERSSLGRRRAALVGQSLAAILLAAIGMPHFEGALLAIVAAQTPALVPAWIAIAWAGAQAIPLLLIILPSHGAEGGLKATGEYLAFSAFAMAVVHLREREATARRDLGRVNATLIATQSLLLDDTRTDERFRLAREVHDAIGHGLTAAGLHLEIAKRTGKPEAIAAAAGAVKATLGELRGLVGAMKIDGEIDLGAALHALAAGIPSPEVGIEIDETLRIEGAERGHALFRCLQEGLTNALRHAGAAHVWIKIELDGADVVATVHDDGQGSSKLVFGHGLEGVRDRARSLGGDIEIAAHPGRGVTLTVRVPRQVPS